MTELQPPETEIIGGPPATAAAPATVPALVAEAPTEKVGPKRQRRPSVRLGDIGDPQYDLQLNRRSKQWKLPMKSSKSRGPMSFGGSSGNYHGEDEGIMDTTTAATLSWKARDSKSRRVSTSTAKRVRSSWMSKVDGAGGGGGGGGVESGGEDVDDGFRDFDFEGSESPLKEQSPFNSLDNFDGERGVHHHEQKRGAKARVSVELDGPSDTDGRNWNHNNNNSDRNGVRDWLNQLGLGRYAPVFEIHEVDDEVLPLLTLEDLKDMGINAVGSRRKMYSSIQKLGKGFS